ncbi:MAG: ABC transporter ATP-binding protein [Anaerolineales bacterium]|nr:MAG: ABC transporter ATP-binding protein [Anaerolineales bacterium]
MTQQKPAPQPGFRPGPPGRGPMGPGHGMPVEHAKDVQSTLKRLANYLWRQKGALLLTVLFVAASSILGLLSPYFMGKAIDDFIDAGILAGLARLLGWMLLANIGASIFTWLQTYVMSGTSQSIIRDLRNELFEKLQTLSLRYFDQHTHGELMSRLSNDVDNISNVLSNTVTQLVSSLLSIIGVAVMMFIINWRLAIISLAVIPLMGAITRTISKHTRVGFRQQQEYLGNLNGIIEETVTGQRVVIAYGREEAAIQSFETDNRALQKAATKAQVYSGFVGPMMNFVNNVSFAIVAGSGGWMVVRGLATIGTIASFINYARQFARPLNQIAQLYNQIQSALAGAERIFEVLDEVAELQDMPDAQPLENIQGEVTFENVCFGYDKHVPVLKHVSLHALPGQTVALVGPTGAGKTTIVNLLTRFYDIDSGRISIDGMDIRHAKKDDLRRQLGIVLQDTFLFGESAMANIHYGRLDATEEEVIAAAKMANADQFIRRLPQGYDTPLSENGSNLSQGQRQLLAIARAILADPGILVLDEATSSVDTRTEKHIQDAMLRLMEGRTSFVIAHRLSTIRDADQVIVINEGEIIERGTHEELLAQGGFYCTMYMSQFKGRQAIPEAVGVAAFGD